MKYLFPYQSLPSIYWPNDWSLQKIYIIVSTPELAASNKLKIGLGKDDLVIAKIKNLKNMPILKCIIYFD